MSKYAQDTQVYQRVIKTENTQISSRLLITGMLINGEVNNLSNLQNYSPGYKFFVNHSILSKIPFKKFQCYLNSILCFCIRNIVYVDEQKDAFEIKGRIEAL